MALIGVEHLRGRGPGQPLVDAQRLHPAHAQQQLLLEAVVTTAAVEAVRDAAGGVVIARNVGIQQQQGNASDVGTPDVRRKAAPVGQRQRNFDGLSASVRGRFAQQRQGQPIRVNDRIRLLLPGVAGQ